MELTMDSPRVLRNIEILASRLAPAVAVGAGTVRTSTEATSAAAAGASFVVSPDCDPDVIGTASHYGMASLPGCFTPTEMKRAVAAGADGIKLFPASCVGPGFVRAVKVPSPELRLVPTGGVTLSNAAEWLMAGAWAIAVGSELFRTGTDLAGLRERAAAFTAVCGCARR